MGAELFPVAAQGVHLPVGRGHNAVEVSAKKFTAKAEDPIKKYTVCYPQELECSGKPYPMILMVNGTGGKATKYEPQFELFASWGFIVVGSQDKGTGSGKTTITTLNYMLAQNEDPGSVFYHKIDLDEEIDMINSGAG